MIVLDLPRPISVNKLRRINWREHKRAKSWCDQADRFLMVAKANKQVSFDRIPRFELHILLSEDHVNVDADNGLKILIDYLRHRDIVENDSKAHMRKLTVEWGHAPAGVRVTITPMPIQTMDEVLQRSMARTLHGG